MSSGGAGDSGGDARLRVDKWLWRARFFKSRSLATQLVSARRVRVNRRIVAKPHYRVKPGDVLTFAKGPQIRVIEVLAIGTRRGPAAEAQMLYSDLSPPLTRAKRETSLSAPPAQREKGAGRPTKRERRATDRLRETSHEEPVNPKETKG